MRELTSKERVKLAFQHKEGDRVPIGELAISENIAAEILGREAWVRCGGDFSGKIVNRMLMEGKREELIQRHSEDTIELAYKTGMDIIYVTAPCWPEKYIKPVETDTNKWLILDKENDMWFEYMYSEDSRTYINTDCSIHERGFSELEKYIDILERKLDNMPVAQGEMDIYNNIVDKAGSEKFIVGNIQEGFPADQSWFPVYLEGMLLEPELIQRYMAVKTKLAIANIVAEAKIGVDAVFGGKDFAGTHGLIISPDQFRRFILPYLKELADACHKNGIMFIKHEDGDVRAILKEFLIESGIDGYHAIEPEAGMDIARIKEEFGSRITLIGNIDCAGLLVNGTEEEIEQSVKDCIKHASFGGGHILSSSNAIHAGVPLKNFLAMLGAAKKYGQYSVKI